MTTTLNAPDVLKSFKTHFDAGDIAKAAKENCISIPTIQTYLNGLGARIDTTNKLIGYFTKILKEREEAISQTLKDVGVVQDSEMLQNIQSPTIAA